MIMSLHKSAAWFWAGYHLQLLYASTLTSPQPSTHLRSLQGEPAEARGQPESIGVTGQLPCEERTNALGLTGCQERRQKRDRFADLPGTSRHSK